MKYLNFKYKFLVIIFIAFHFMLSAQNETANWYFGNTAGMSFNQGNTNILNDGVMIAPSGCASISNTDGNLLFYTNGESVWNANHVIMENGNNLSGMPTHTQSSIIVPNPENENVYYIFSTRSENGNSFLKGLYYSVVEFSEMFPLGRITDKNILIFNAICERITATYLPSENYYKVLVMSSEPYEYAFGQPIPPNDINTFTFIDVTSSGVAFSTSITAEYTTLSEAGTMKISPNGQHLAIADNGFNRIYIYDIDASANSITYSNFIFTGLFGAPDIIPYSLEFSENSDIIYFTSHLGNSSFLYKYEHNSGADVVDKVLISSSSDIKYGDLQLAIDGSIYLANYSINGEPLNDISIIKYPNKVDVEECEFRESSIDLSPHGSFRGLPNFVTSFFENHIITDHGCVYDDISFEVNSYSNVDAVFWDFGDGSTSTSLNSTHQYSNPGEYIISAVASIGNKDILLYRKIIVYALPSTTDNYILEQCDVDNDGISIFNLYDYVFNIDNSEFEEFELSFFNTNEDALSNTNPINNPEHYQNTINGEEIFVRIKNNNNCVTQSNFFLEANYALLENIPTVYTCEDSDGIDNNGLGYFYLRDVSFQIINQFSLPLTSTIMYYETLEDAQSNNNAIPLGYITDSKIIWVKVINDNDCGGIGQMNLVVNQPQILNIEDTYQLCKLNPFIIVDGGLTNDSWQWLDVEGNVLSNQRLFEINSPGNYSVIVNKEDNGIICSYTKDFNVLAPSIVEFSNIELIKKNININVLGTSNYEFSLDNVSFYGSGNSHTFYNVNPGIVNLYVRDQNGCEDPIQTQISFLYTPEFFSPNGDTKNDTWLIQGITKSIYQKADVFIFDRYGKVLQYFNIDTIHLGWDGTYNSNKLPASEYWYKSTLIDKNNVVYETSGHFSLKR